VARDGPEHVYFETFACMEKLPKDRYMLSFEHLCRVQNARAFSTPLLWQVLD
jgi:hypothetical protein